MPALPRATAPAASRPALPITAHFSRWEYHYNRNALEASATIGKHVIALSAAGHLLKFDAQTLTFEGEALSQSALRVLGPATDRELLVGLESGRIARVALPELEMTTVASVPGVPLWLGKSAHGELLVVYVEAGGPRAERRTALRWLSSGREVTVPLASSFYLDREDRLWLGEDHGEWGGALTRVDLASGQVNDVAFPNQVVENIYGLIEVAPGEVWAYGGMQHFMSDSLVVRVSPAAQPVTLFSNGPLSGKARRRDTNAPAGPITHMIAKAPGKWLAFAYDGLFEVDRQFRFRRLNKLALKYSPGRPDAIGSYPAVTSVHAQAGRWLLTTGLQGLMTYQGGALAPHDLPGQLGVAPEGILFEQELVLFDYNAASLWDGEKWQTAARPERDEEEPSNEPPRDPIAQRIASAVEAERTRVGSAPAPYYRVHGLPKISAAADWDARHVLLATDRGLCLLPKTDSDECEPLTLPGLDGTVEHLARDGSGRLWLAGNGLWFVRDAGYAVAVHETLPFMDRTTVRALAIRGDTLVLALGDRGVALLRLTELVEEAQ